MVTVPLPLALLILLWVGVAFAWRLDPALDEGGFIPVPPLLGCGATLLAVGLSVALLVWWKLG